MKYLKLLLPLLLIALMLLVPGYAMASDKPIQLYLNEKPLQPEVDPKIVDPGVTLVPARIIAEELKSKVSWLEQERAVLIERGQTVIELKVDHVIAKANGVSWTLEAAPVIEEGNTLVPVRFIAEQLGLNVVWKEDLPAVYLQEVASGSDSFNEQPTDNSGKPDPSDDDKGTSAESGTETTGNNGTGTSGNGANDNAGTGTNGTGTNGNADTGTNGSGTTGNSGTGTNGSGTTGNSGTGTNGSGTTGNSDTGTNGSGTTGNSGTGTGTNENGTSSPSHSSPGSSDSEQQAPAALSMMEVSGDEFLFRTSRQVVPVTSTLSSPFRIIFDLPDTTLGVFAKPGQNDQLVKEVDHPKIERIRYSQYSDNPSTVRIVLDMKQVSDYHLTETASVRQWAVSFQDKAFTVVLDAGHGGKDPGASSIGSRQEKDFNLPVAKKVYELLQQDASIKTILTRHDDTYPTLDERVAIANGASADLFVSIHGNSHTSKATNGSETYYSDAASLSFAKLMHQKITAVSGLADRGVRQMDFKVIRETSMPGVLLEIGYLSNAGDEAVMFTDEFQTKVAGAIAEAIREQLAKTVKPAQVQSVASDSKQSSETDKQALEAGKAAAGAGGTAASQTDDAAKLNEPKTSDASAPQSVSTTGK